MTFLAIGDNADDETGVAFPSIEYLAWKTRLSRRSVQYAIKQLEESGWIKVRYGAGDNRENLYLIDVGRLHDAAEKRYAEFRETQKEKRESRIEKMMGKGGPRPSGTTVDSGMDSLFERVQPLHGGANDDTRGCKSQQLRVQTTTPEGANDDTRGCNPCTLTIINHQEPPENHQGEGACAPQSPHPEGNTSGPPAGLTPHQLAGSLLESLGVPQTMAIYPAVVSSLQILAREMMADVAAAYTAMLASGKEAQHQGETITRWWFEDQRWRANPVRSEATVGAHRVAPTERKTDPIPSGLDVRRGAEAWKAISARLREKVPKHSFDVWFRPVKACGMDAVRKLYLAVPSEEFLHIRNRFTADVLSTTAASIELLIRG